MPVALYSGDDAFVAETEPLFPGAIGLRPVASPVAVRVEATSVALADLFAMLPIVRRVGALGVEFSSPTMRHAIRALNSLSAMAFMLR